MSNDLNDDTGISRDDSLLVQGCSLQLCSSCKICCCNMMYVSTSSVLVMTKQRKVSFFCKTETTCTKSKYVKRFTVHRCPLCASAVLVYSASAVLRSWQNLKFICNFGQYIFK
ncbi:hypothetical protein GJ496_010287 [Pomphorhynchus laevis]|nr:hypothetical protein GJ496_010287 [Pomphorhynchus laevis]